MSGQLVATKIPNPFFLESEYDVRLVSKIKKNLLI